MKPTRYRSIRWSLFFSLAAIMLVCQTITAMWLWHESKEQIDAILNSSLTSESLEKVIEHEQLESLFALLFSIVMMFFVTLFLSYRTIKSVIKPLETLDNALQTRTAENLQPITYDGKTKEIHSITEGLNDLFTRLNSTLIQERLFTADVAHELRTPLAGIRLHLELLEKTEKIECQELISRIDRLVKTVEQLLTLSRASQKFSLGQYQAITFENDIKGSLYHEFNELAAQKQQSVIWNSISPELNIQGDKTLILLLIRNLFENSHRYSGEKTEIEIRCHQNHSNVIIEVNDQSDGIDESKFEQLTQAFYRMDKKHKGIGLGLSIVSRIAKLHQADFSIKNRTDGIEGTSAKLIFNKKR